MLDDYLLGTLLLFILRSLTLRWVVLLSGVIVNALFCQPPPQGYNMAAWRPSWMWTDGAVTRTTPTGFLSNLVQRERLGWPKKVRKEHLFQGEWLWISVVIVWQLKPLPWISELFVHQVWIPRLPDTLHYFSVSLISDLWTCLLSYQIDIFSLWMDVFFPTAGSSTYRGCQWMYQIIIGYRIQMKMHWMTIVNIEYMHKHWMIITYWIIMRKHWIIMRQHWIMQHLTCHRLIPGTVDIL